MTADTEWTVISPPTPERLALEAPVIPITEETPPEDQPEEIQSRGRHARADSGSTTGERRKPGRPPKADKKPAKPPTGKIPDFTEWSDYIGNFALKWAGRAYIAFVFRGLDRYSLLSPEDAAAIELDEEQLTDIAKPIAHLANRSKLGNRYGRVLIDSTDSVAAIIQLFMWGNRVNRIAQKYRRNELEKAGAINGEALGSGPAGENVADQPATIRQQPQWSANGYGFN
jgi:hypothetical protein